MKQLSLVCKAQVSLKTVVRKATESAVWMAACVLAGSSLLSPSIHADLIQTETLDANLLGDFVMDLSNNNVVVNSVSLVGSAGQIATFTNGLSVPGFLDFDDGLLMSSGTVSAIAGPNAADGTGSDVPSGGAPDGDAQFDTLTDAPQGTFDAVYIVIDFTPAGDTLTGNFVFSSEEYNEYAPPAGAQSANNTYYDVMAFFVNDVNYSTTADGDDVSINSVNQTLNAADFVDNDYGDYQPGATPFDIEPDGFTKTLVWTAPVNAGQSNTLKFGVADGGDSSYDSWLLVEKGSFRVFDAPTDVDLALSINDGGDEVVATNQLPISAIVENVGSNTANREISVDFTLPAGVTVNNGLAASVAETGTNGDEWVCLSSATSPQTVSCSSVTPLYTTPGNTQSQFGFETDALDVALIGSTVVVDAVVSTTDNDTNAANDTVAESALVVISDTTAPSVVISGMPSVTGSLAPIPVLFTFSEDVSALSLASVAVVNGTASNLIVVDAQHVTVDVTPDGMGDIAVSLAGGVVQDLAGNASSAAGPITTLFDVNSPVLTINNVPANGVSTAPFTLTLDFSEPVSDFVIADVLVGNGNATGLTVIDADSYELTVVADGSSDVTISIPSGAAQSVQSGTDSSAAGVTIALNASAPFATISGMPPSGVVTGPYTLTITWSEEVNGMELADLEIVNGIASNLTPTSTTGTVYTVEITPQAQGLVSVSIPDMAVTDVGGIGNLASLVVDTLFDTVPPADPTSSPALAASSDTGSSSSDRITMLQDVVINIPPGTAIEGEVATLTQQGVEVGTAVVQSDGSFSYSATGLVEGDNTFSYTLTDIAGNVSGQSPELLVVVDLTAPNATISPIPFASNTNLNAYPVSGSCSAVGGLVTVDIVGALPSSSTVACSGSGVWTTSFDLTPIADGVGAVTATAVHSDIAGNTVPTLQVVANKDTSSPTITIAPVSVDDLLNAAEAQAALTVVGTTTDIGNGQQVSISLNGQSYSATVTDDAWSVIIPAVDVQQFGAIETIVADVSTAIGLAAPQVIRTISLDTQAPTAPSVDALITNSTTPVITGTAVLAAGEQLSVTVNGTTYLEGQGQLVVDVNGNWTLTIPAGDALGEGVVEVVATVVDTAGNSTSDVSTQELEVDTTDPLVSISALPFATTTNVGSYPVSGACSVGDLSVSVTVTGAEPETQSVACSGGTWSALVDLTIVPDGIGSVSVSATQSDVAGNTTTATPVVANKDTSSPTIAIAAVSVDDLLNAAEAQVALTVGGTTTGIVNGQQVSVALNGQSYSATVTGDAWSVVIPAVDVQQFGATESIVADVSTAIGLAAPQVVRTISLDTQAPTAPSVDALVTNSTTPVITGTAVLAAGEQLSVTVNGTTYLEGQGQLVV
ncbi:MAG: choice-of-anchor L domain-containing protein, partial [Granulosicoccus sp.]